MHKIIVFGATGGTGLQVVQQALSAGYKVTVVVRTPDAFKIIDNNLEVIKGDVLQPGTFENLFNGNDAIISCLGSKALRQTVIYSKGINKRYQCNGQNRRSSHCLHFGGCGCHSTEYFIPVKIFSKKYFTAHIQIYVCRHVANGKDSE